MYIYFFLSEETQLRLAANELPRFGDYIKGIGEVPIRVAQLDVWLQPMYQLSNATFSGV